MSNDKTTLADAQPGGRVRLGDALLPCPLCGNDAEFVPYKDNGLTLKCKSMGCIQRNQRTLRYGIDWLRTSMAEHWNTRALSAQPSPGGQDGLVQEALEYFERAGDAGDRQYVAAIRAALAARQPVGCGACGDGCTDRAGCRVVEENPPAQAVDLGRIRSTVQALLNWIDDWAETPEESGIDAIEIEAAAVLDLIDSHTAGGQP